MSKRRIYFLVPNVESTKAIVDELLLARIEERHIHIVARQDTPLAELPEAGVAQSTDLIPAMEKGVLAGGATGLLAGVLAVTFPPAGLVLGGGAVLGLTALSAGFGAWMAGMVGIGLPNSQLEKFKTQIEAGQLLMIIDVPRIQVDDIEALVKLHHAEAELKGIEANIPAYP